MTIKYQVDSPDLADVCLFSSYSFSGIVEEYVYYYLAQIKKAGFSIAFISTSPLTEACVGRLSQFAFLIIERKNRCPDFGSWKTGLSLLNWGRRLNSILLVNDSVFGPFYDLADIISSMKKRYDIWGMTDSHEIEYHIQSYFIYFNKAAISCDLFPKFWKNVDLSATKDQVIHNYEIGMSSLFNKSHLTLGAYASIDILTENYNHRLINPTLVFWRSLIKKYKFPFLKRELIIKRHISKTYWNVALYVNVGNWKRTIEESCDYPIEFITAFMNNYYNTIRVVNSNIALRKRKLLFLSKNAEIGGAQKVLLSFLQWLKRETDIEIEIIICKEGSNELGGAFASLGIVTYFSNLVAAEKIQLKERLVNEVALVFSNSIENLAIQKYFSFLDAPQIIYVHELDATVRDTLLADNNIKWLRDSVTQFIASSQVAHRNIVKYFGIDENKVELIYKFIDSYCVENFTKEGQLIRSDLGISPDTLVVGMCGRFDRKNSADLLPVIGANLCRHHEKVHILWLGADSSSPFYESVLTDLERAGLSDRVHLIEKKSDIRPWFAAFDVFVMCSREDAFPLVNLESAMAGKPVICFEQPGGQSEYESLGIGHSVTYLDFTALAEKVSGYFDKGPQLKLEKDFLQKKISENFTTAIQAPKIMQVINRYYDSEELMFTDDPLVAFMTHIYYEDSWDDIRSRLKNFDNGKNYFLFSVSEACLDREKIIESIRTSFKNSYFLVTSNIGKDIGGKLALIDLYLFLEIRSSYIVFLHDKMSPHSIRGEKWKNELFRIIEPNNKNPILSLFNDPKTGIVGAKEHIVNEYDKSTGLFYNNNHLSKKLLMQFGIAIENYEFLGGSMYWLRSSIIENFFTKNHPIQMRENLESGNVLDLYEEKLAHTWERMFSWIATNDGYTIKGI